MGIRLSKKPNLKKYEKRIEEAGDKLYSIAESTIVGIIKRTQSGKDKNLSKFKPYSRNYKKTGTVNLTVTGAMLHGIERRKRGNGVSITMSASEVKKAQGNQKTRKFFGLDDKQEKYIVDELGKYVVKS